MKEYIFGLLKSNLGICLTGLCQANRNADNNTERNADRLAQYMSQKIRDSLSLTKKQTEKVYKVNLKIYDQKSKARNQIQELALLTKAIQKIENDRDDMYSKSSS